MKDKEDNIEIEPFTFKGDTEEERERFRHYNIGARIFELLNEEEDK